MNRQITDVLADLRQYPLPPVTCTKVSQGSGSDCWRSTCTEGNFLLKYVVNNGMNHPEEEINLCAFLTKHNLPVSRFLMNNEGAFLSYTPDGSCFHVQDYIAKKTYRYHNAPSWLLPVMAKRLGEIHQVLSAYPPLASGIGEAFFAYRTIERVLASYERSLQIALANEDIQNATELRWRIDFVKNYPFILPDLSKLTCTNTHGDYGVNQLLCASHDIYAIIDWTSACVHPVIWEIVRSYLYATKSSKEGTIAIPQFLAYVQAYQQHASLTVYDLQQMIPLFLYQSAVSDYYGQYYASTDTNRELFLFQAHYTTKLLRNLSKQEQTITEALLQAITV